MYNMYIYIYIYIYIYVCVYVYVYVYAYVYVYVYILGNKVLLVTVTNVIYPVNVDCLFKVFKMQGNVHKIVTFTKQGKSQADILKRPLYIGCI